MVNALAVGRELQSAMELRMQIQMKIRPQLAVYLSWMRVVGLMGVEV